MKRELTPNEIKFDISIDKNIEKSNNVPEYEDAFAKIKRALKIKTSFNLQMKTLEICLELLNNYTNEN